MRVTGHLWAAVWLSRALRAHARGETLPAREVGRLTLSHRTSSWEKLYLHCREGMGAASKRIVAESEDAPLPGSYFELEMRGLSVGRR